MTVIARRPRAVRDEQEAEIEVEYRTVVFGSMRLPTAEVGESDLLGFAADLISNLDEDSSEIHYRLVEGDDHWRTLPGSHCCFRPQLTEEQAAGINNGNNDFVGPAYNACLWQVALDVGPRDLLAASIVAGVVPHYEGIEMALEAMFLYETTTEREKMAQCDREVPGSGSERFSLEYALGFRRRLQDMLTRQAAALESALAALPKAESPE